VTSGSKEQPAPPPSARARHHGRRRRALTAGAWFLAVLLIDRLAFTQTIAAPQPPVAIVTGTIVDDVSTPVSGALVKLTRDDATPLSEAVTGNDGVFSLTGQPGPLRLTVSAPGFAERTLSVRVEAGESSTLPPIRLTIAAGVETVDVVQTVEEVAQLQIEAQEQQRVLGVFPNVYVTYVPNAAPLNTRQKFELTWKARLDPVQFATVAVVAGVQQVRKDFPEFGEGLEGYAKRYAAAYATGTTQVLLTNVAFPALFRQDPRYFYNGTGSVPSRIGYALATTVIRKGDNGHWQPNFSGILGSLTSGWLSNYYYPDDRRALNLALQNTAIGLISNGISRLAQEFLLARVTSRGGAKGAASP
jgi:hypothetical protein